MKVPKIELGYSGKPCSDQRIREIEHEIGRKLPLDYADFIKSTGGGVVSAKNCALERVYLPSGILLESHVDCIFGNHRVGNSDFDLAKRGQYLSETWGLPQEVLLIGYAESGMRECFVINYELSEFPQYSVLYYDNESDDGFVLVAESFSKFLTKLRPHPNYKETNRSLYGRTRGADAVRYGRIGDSLAKAIEVCPVPNMEEVVRKAAEPLVNGSDITMADNEEALRFQDIIYYLAQPFENHYSMDTWKDTIRCDEHPFRIPFLLGDSFRLSDGERTFQYFESSIMAWWRSRTKLGVLIETPHGFKLKDEYIQEVIEAIQSSNSTTKNKIQSIYEVAIKYCGKSFYCNIGKRNVTKLPDIELYYSGKACGGRKIRAIEDRIGRKLPLDYAEFIKKTGGGSPSGKNCVLDGVYLPSGVPLDSPVDCIFGYDPEGNYDYDILENVPFLSEEWELPQEVLLIGHAESGMHECFVINYDLTDFPQHSVLYLDNESDGGFILVAESFSEFLAKLRPEDNYEETKCSLWHGRNGIYAARYGMLNRNLITAIAFCSVSNIEEVLRKAAERLADEDIIRVGANEDSLRFQDLIYYLAQPFEDHYSLDEWIDNPNYSKFRYRIDTLLVGSFLDSDGRQSLQYFDGSVIGWWENRTKSGVLVETPEGFKLKDDYIQWLLNSFQ